MALAAPGDLATYLGETFTTAQTVTAQLALDIASGVVVSQTGQKFAAGSSTVFLPTPDGQWLTLPQTPVTEVTSVKVSGVAVTDFSVVGGRLFRYAGWSPTDWTAAPVVEVAYSHGGAVPDDVKGAVLAIGADIFENPSGLSSETIDDYTWRRSDSERGSWADSQLARIVKTYRRRPLTVALR